MAQPNLLIKGMQMKNITASYFGCKLLLNDLTTALMAAPKGVEWKLPLGFQYTTHRGQWLH
jgi:hypothetical protein